MIGGENPSRQIILLRMPRAFFGSARTGLGGIRSAVMINQDNGTIVLTLGLVLALGGVVLVLQNDQGRSIDATPNFSTFQDVNAKKTAFFSISGTEDSGGQ